MAANPWDRRSGEVAVAYRAFLAYRDLGPTRSHAAATEALGAKSRSNLSEWSKRHEWVERCRAWDAHLQAERQRGIEKATRDEAELWAKRKAQQMHEDFAFAQKLMVKVKLLADFPVTEQVSKDGRTVVKPISPRDLRDAAAIAKDAQAMAWGAINQAIPPDADDFDPSTATAAECRAYLEGKGRLRADQGPPA